MKTVVVTETAQMGSNVRNLRSPIPARRGLAHTYPANRDRRTRRRKRRRKKAGTGDEKRAHWTQNIHFVHVSSFVFRWTVVQVGGLIMVLVTERGALVGCGNESYQKEEGR